MSDGIGQNEFDARVRTLIDLYLAGGGSSEDVEKILSKHVDGASYYEEDMERYLNLIGLDVGDIDYDSVREMDTG